MTTPKRKRFTNKERCLSCEMWEKEYKRMSKNYFDLIGSLLGIKNLCMRAERRGR